MKLIISHFFNEEYLLPWWLKHHREIFDHGVLIDYHSTDRSVEICRELVPEWEIVTSTNKYFSGLKCDFEVMQHEARHPDAWKIALNTTEFLVGDELDAVIEGVESQNLLGVYIPGAAMIDNVPGMPVEVNAPLVAQRFHGFWESEFPVERVQYPWFFPRARTRLLHRYAFGAYTPGRHTSMLPRLTQAANTQLGIWWYGYSPWTPDFIARKTQIQTKMDPLDKSVGMGVQHIATEHDQHMRHKALLQFAHDLNMNPTVGGTDTSKAQLVEARNDAIAERDASAAELFRIQSELDLIRADRDEAVRICQQEIEARRHAQKYPWKYIGMAWRLRDRKRF